MLMNRRPLDSNGAASDQQTRVRRQAHDGWREGKGEREAIHTQTDSTAVIMQQLMKYSCTRAH